MEQSKHPFWFCCFVFLPRDHNFDYLEFRLWIGLWSAFMCLILVATDASFLVQYFTRFTEEGFSSLISFIFIYDAFKKMIKLADYYPINSDFKVGYNTHFSCACLPPDPGKETGCLAGTQAQCWKICELMFCKKGSYLVFPEES